MSDSDKKKGWKDKTAKCSQIIAISGSSENSDNSEMKLRVSSNSQFGQSSSCSNFSESSLSSFKLEDIDTPSSFNSSAELGCFVSCDSSSVPSENDSCIKNSQINSFISPNSTIAYCQNVYREATDIVESFRRNMNMTLNDPEKSINSNNDSFKWKTPGHCFKKLYDSASKNSNSATANTSATFLDSHKVFEGLESGDNSTSPTSRFSILDLENMDDNLIGTPSSKSWSDDTNPLNETIFYRESADSREIGPDFLNSSSSTSGNMSAIFKEAHKVLDALDGEVSPPSSRLTILDLNKLDDRLLCTPHSKTPRKAFVQERFSSPGGSSPKISQMLIRDIAAIAARCNVDLNLTHISELIQQDSKTNKKLQSCEPDVRSNGSFTSGVSKDSDVKIERTNNPYLNGTFDTEEKISDCLKEKGPNNYLNGTFELDNKKSNIQKESNDTVIKHQTNLKCQEEKQENRHLDGTFVTETGAKIERKATRCLDGTFDAEEKISDCQKEKLYSHLNGTFQKESNGTFSYSQKNLKCQEESQENRPMDGTFVAKTDKNLEENIKPRVPPDDAFNRGIHQLNKEGTFVLDQASPRSSPIPRVAEAGPLNETFEKDKNVPAAGFNSTFDAQTQADIEEDLNRTFEVVGNGSFIIEGKCTNLMDMESNDLNTVLYSTPLKNEEKSNSQSTPVIHKKETDHPKHTLKTTLLKRLSQSDLHPQSLFVKDKISTHTNGEDKSGKNAVNLDKFEAFENKASNRIRLRKTNSGSSCTGPMKAMPLPIPLDTQCLPRHAGVQQRLTSTPVSAKNKMVVVAGKNSCDSTSTQTGAKETGFPSFGSVSSIETEGPISMDSGSHCLSTPEVFRPTEKRTGPRTTSTPAMGQVNFGYSSFETAPTPIVSSSSKSEVRRLRKSNSTGQEVLDDKQQNSQDSTKIETENGNSFNQPINRISFTSNESLGNENSIPSKVNMTTVCNQPNPEFVPANKTHSPTVTETKELPKSILPDSGKKDLQTVSVTAPRSRAINSGAKASETKLGSNLRSVATRREALSSVPAKCQNKNETPRSNASIKVNIGKKIFENKTNSRAKNAIVSKPRQPLTVKPSNQDLKSNPLKKGAGSGNVRESLMPSVTSKSFKSRLSVNKEVLSSKLNPSSSRTSNMNKKKIAPLDKENAIPQLKGPKRSTIPVSSSGSKPKKTFIPVPRKIT